MTPSVMNPEGPATATPTVPAAEAVARLRQLVRTNGTRLRCLLALEALGLAVAVPLAYLWLVFFLDTRLHLPLFGRVLACLGLLGGLGWAGLHLARRWRALRLTEDQVALAIERRTPGGVQNRLINAVQLARQAATGDIRMSSAVIEENYQALRQLHLEQAARLRPALLRMGLAIGLIGVGLLFWLLQPAHFTNSAARILLPFASIDPLYRTTLLVEPGDVDLEAVGDVTVRITIRGERPESLTVSRKVRGEQTSEVVAVEPGDGPVSYTFRGVSQSTAYAVQGGDFTTRYYRITVPGVAVRLRVTYRYPDYTGLAERSVESAGDLEALRGTRARVVFHFDEPLESAALILDRPGDRQDAARPLERVSDREYAGEILLEDVRAYRLESKRPGLDARRNGPFTVRVLKDQEPKLELSGLERGTEVAVDAVLPLQVAATDDYGLEKVGLFYRRQEADGAAQPVKDEGWREVVVWPAGRQTSFKRTFDLAVANLQAAEGDRLTLSLKAADTDPLRNGAWVTGPVLEFVVGGEGANLQLQYEQLVRSEAELKALLASERKLLTEAAGWLNKLDGAGGLKWDEAKDTAALHAAVRTLKTEQERLRKDAGKAARAMLVQTGNLRIAVSLLADSEMVRGQRIFESVPGRTALAAKREALADARLTGDRIVRSLQEILEQYATFRGDWELGHMIPFAKMLAERQAKMRDQSKALAGRAAGKAEEFARKSMGRRQGKVLELCGLIRPAFLGIAGHLEEQEPDIAKAFVAGAGTLASAELRKPLRLAAAEASAGRWRETAQHQTAAAKTLAELHARLRQAQAEAARKALEALKARAKSDLQAQKELERLKPGSGDAFVKDFPDGIKLEDVIRLREVAGSNKKFPNLGKDKGEIDNTLLDVDVGKLELKKDSGVRQDPNVLSLAKAPFGQDDMNLPLLGKNKVKPFIQEKFADLVGKLLDEAEELTKDYQSLTLSTNQNNNDPGDIGKIGGRINSTGAVAATGNQKPPALDSGGVSRTGRQGARAHGMVADSDGVDRRGRDKAQEGQEQVADQAGRNKLQKSDDMQRDTSTGIGGKKVESNDSHFSLSDVGKWRDEMSKRLEKPQAKKYLVERRGDKFDARLADQLRDLGSKQEQVIERLKAIKKELRNLYLPTEHLDELAAALASNLEGLKDRPEAELFRLQLQTLAKLRSAARVFRGATAGLEPSLPRERAIRGRVLDEPGTPTLPGYDEAVKDYYLKLANQ